MKIAVHQPNYAPWCGFFAKLRHCDTFVFLDDAQMPGGQSYVYRTQVKGNQNPVWISIPTHSHFGETIMNVHFANTAWPKKHLGTLRSYYGRAPYFQEVFALLLPLYQAPGDLLSVFNQRMIVEIAHYLGLKCRFEVSSHLLPEGSGDDRLISIAQKLQATTYISGKGGRNYQDPAKFAAAGIDLDVRAYSPIPYDQGGSNFVAGLSILDALFNLGRDSVDLLRYPDVWDFDNR